MEDVVDGQKKDGQVIIGEGTTYLAFPVTKHPFQLIQAVSLSFTVISFSNGLPPFSPSR